MLRQRALSAAIFVPPLLLVLLLGEPWFGLLVLAFAAVAAFEVSGLLRMAGFPVAQPVVVGAALVAALAFAVVVSAPICLLALAAVFVATGIAGFREPDPRTGFGVWMAGAFGSVYAGMLGSLPHLGQIVPAVPSSAAAAVLGAERGWVLLLILVVWSYDTGAYCVGIPLGKRKFLSHISPSKSYWGLFGGLAAATIVAVAGLWALGQPPAMGLVAGPVLGLVAQAGDLAESMLKRAAGAKDSGRLIPGHGGILDRVDSFIFAAPVATLLVAAFVR